jgi:hypothetical protein
MRNSAAASLAIAALLGACAAPEPGEKQVDAPPAPGQPVVEESVEANPPPSQPGFAGEAPADKPSVALKRGAIERFDCMSGAPDWHARIAFEAQGGQVLNFAYYSIWKPRTCSLEVKRNTAGAKWTTTPDGAMRVQTPQGQFLIRTTGDAYIFHFEHVRRQKFCGMPGEINGTMTVKRTPGKPQCTVAGIMDTNDAYLDALYKKNNRPGLR